MRLMLLISHVYIASLKPQGNKGKNKPGLGPGPEEANLKRLLENQFQPELNLPGRGGSLADSSGRRRISSAGKYDR